MDGHWLTVRHKMPFGKTVIPAAVDERGMWARPAASAGGAAAAAAAAGAGDSTPELAAATASPAGPHTPAPLTSAQADKSVPCTAARAGRSGALGAQPSAHETPVLQRTAVANPGTRSSRRRAAAKGLSEEAMQAAALDAAAGAGAAGMQTRKRGRQGGSAGDNEGRANVTPEGRHSVKRKR